MKDIFEFIKAAKFFPAYLPHIKDWKKKMTGKNGRGNPTDFTNQEKNEIKQALNKLFKDLS